MNAATLSGPDVTRSMTPAMRASRMLGWVSFAIGAAELLAPKKTARAVGMDEKHSGLLRAYGAREMLAGVGSHSVYPVPALLSRVAGDLLDLGTLAVAARRTSEGGRDRRAWIAMAAVAGITVIDALVAAQLASETKEGKGEPKDYSDRSGFPGGVGAARGAGIVGGAEGKAGGAAAGDSSPAGESVSGRTSTDLAGASAGDQRTSSGVGGSDKGTGGFIGSGQGSSDKGSPDKDRAIPQPAGFTPA